MVPEDRPAPGADCAATRELLSKFLHGGLKPGEDRQFRTHITQCPECRDLYRETLASAAQLGRAMRTERTERERELRHERLRASAMAAGKRIRPKRRFGLRLMLLPVAFILLLALWPRFSRNESLVLRWDGGEVRAAGQMLNADRPEVVLDEGDWCYTSGNARASIDGTTCTFELGLRTQIMVEGLDTGRVRLQQGELIASGQLVVSSAFGVLEMEEGTAVLRIHGAEFELECRAGEAAWSAPGVRRTLAAGERL